MQYLTNYVQIDMLKSQNRLEDVALLITRETDYALRILRALMDGELHTVGQIAQDEFLPQAFAYKILKKLAAAGLIQVTRGTTGGCRLTADLTNISLHELMVAIGERSNLSACMDSQYQCPWSNSYGACKVHSNLAKIQEKLDGELRQYSLADILS